jgi:hypothetical protein
MPRMTRTIEIDRPLDAVYRVWALHGPFARALTGATRIEERWPQGEVVWAAGRDGGAAAFEPTPRGGTRVVVTVDAADGATLDAELGRFRDEAEAAAESVVGEMEARGATGGLHGTRMTGSGAIDES